ncbi:MAG: hypothetical protein KDK25_12070 [Leptospiraceae bacterium]|nr:hypothetical protein [Leptospiraceae bacterium]
MSAEGEPIASGARDQKLRRIPCPSRDEENQMGKAVFDCGGRISCSLFESSPFQDHTRVLHNADAARGRFIPEQERTRQSRGFIKETGNGNQCSHTETG